MKKFFKGARMDGWDWKTEKTINYRDNIGKVVYVPKKSKDYSLCSDTVLHAAIKPNDIFIGSKIPSSVYIVTGKPIVYDDEKCGFTEMKVVEEIPQEDLDKLFGWKYSEATEPIHPFKIVPAKVGDVEIELLKNWASVRASVWAYIGSLFPNIKKWKGIQHKKGEYPFQCVVDLWKKGLVPSFDGKTWRLHGGRDGAVLFEMLKAA